MVIKSPKRSCPLTVLFFNFFTILEMIHAPAGKTSITVTVKEGLINNMVRRLVKIINGSLIKLSITCTTDI